MLSRVSHLVLRRGAPLALLFAVGLSGVVSIVAPTTARAEFNPRQCLNWGQFGVWEMGPMSSLPQPDTIDRNGSARQYILPEGGGRMLGSISVPV